MMRRSWKFALFAVAAFAAQRTSAGILPVGMGPPAADGSNFRYTYGVVLTSDSTLKSGDYFTIFDFKGYVPGAASSPPGWTLSVANTGGNPNGIVPNDNPTLPNLTWTYNGPSLTGQLGLGSFSALSSIGQTTSELGGFASLTQRQVDSANEANVTGAVVPFGDTPPGGGGGGGPPPGVPEPSTLLLLGIGAPLAGAFRYLRGNRQPAAA